MIWFYISGEEGADVAKRREKDKVLRNVVVKVVHPFSFILQAELNPKYVSVQIRGASHVVDKLTSESILVFVDVSALNKGKYVLPVQIKLPADVKLVQITPLTVKVLLKDIIGISVPSLVQEKG
ncbi:MAG: CdaR family protein [bacterium]|nr:CdaR family protein [bacterium]